MVNYIKELLKKPYASLAVIIASITLAHHIMFTVAEPLSSAPETFRNFFYYSSLIALLGLFTASWMAWHRIKKYHTITGRHFLTDRRKYNKTYQELLDFFQKSDPYKLDISNLPIADWHDTDGIILGKVGGRLIRRPSDADGNLLCFGLPGSGKSTCQGATSMLQFNYNRGRCGVFAISIKGDLLNFARGKRPNIKVFTPDSTNGSYHYDPFHGVDKMTLTERRVFAESLSIIICPDEQGENAAFFVNGARDYFCGILLYLFDKNINIRFPEVVTTILNSDVFSITKEIQSSGCQIAGEYTNSYIGSSEKNVSGIYNNLCKNVRPFNNGALPILFDGQGQCITPDDLATGDIIVDVPQDKYQVYAPAMAIIISSFLMAFMRRDDVSSGKAIKPILFLLDEAVQLNLDFNLLSQAMSTLRSKKVSIFMLVQSIAQIEGRYGEAHCREIIDLCPYISCFSAQDPKSREFFQKLIGRREVMSSSVSTTSLTDRFSHSSSENIKTEKEYILEAADLGNLDGKVLIYANGMYTFAEETPCYE